MPGPGYAHVMVGADGTKAEHAAVFRLADGRGKGVSKSLVGTNYQMLVLPTATPVIPRSWLTSKPASWNTRTACSCV
jgi:hypothetical protein